MNRRQFLAGGLGLAIGPRSFSARRPRILLRSSWQTVNIGDIAHTPGVIRLLEQYVPEADVVLWPGSVADGVEAMLRGRFPRLEIVQTEEQITAALRSCDFFLHGSGPYLVGWQQLARWRRETRKPYGVYGVTLSAMEPNIVELLNGAEFVYLRDSVSLELARRAGCKSRTVEFAPDGAFAVDLKDEGSATRFLDAKGLKPGGYLCCIPRLRKTPYWKIHSRMMTEEDKKSDLLNDRMKESDHRPLIESIRAVVEKTELSILLCPEDRSQMQVGKENIYDKLPADIQKRVVWRDSYWLTNEARSVYLRSAGLFGHEMHSPIICIGSGIPAIVCRWKEQTSKGFMWKDIGLNDWLFDLDKPDEASRVSAAVLDLALHPEAARQRARLARLTVEKRQKETMQRLRSCLPDLR